MMKRVKEKRWEAEEEESGSRGGGGGGWGGWASAPLQSDSFTPVVESFVPALENTWERRAALSVFQPPSWWGGGGGGGIFLTCFRSHKDKRKRRPYSKRTARLKRLTHFTPKLLFSSISLMETTLFNVKVPPPPRQECTAGAPPRVSARTNFYFSFSQRSYEYHVRGY